MNEKLDFFTFLKKIEFLIGEEFEIEQLNLSKVPIYHINEFKLLPNDIFIEEMYKILLNRVFDEVGKTTKVNELKQGKRREDIVKDMINSEEGQNYVDKYKFLGINKPKFLNKQFLFQNKYSDYEFNFLIKFFEFKFKNYKFSNYITDLLFFNGNEFIYLLYKLLLKRTPDIEGFHHHLKGSYLLKDKLNKIYEFLHSTEAKHKNINYFDLNNKNILEYSSSEEINYDKISNDIFEKILFLKRELKEYNFYNIFSEKILCDIITISNLTKDPLKNCNIFINEILNNNKTILEIIYKNEIIDFLKEEIIIIDYFQKPLQKDYFLVDDYIRNLNYYLNLQINNENDLINEFNLSLLNQNIANDISSLISFIKTMGMKDDIFKLLDIDKGIVSKLNILAELVKEHEEILLNLKGKQ